MLGPLKTRKSRRTVVLGRHVTEALARRRDDVPSRYLFTLPDGTWQHPDTIRSHLSRSADKAGLPGLHPPDLRHTCATLLLMQATNPKAVSERLGHASIVVTLSVYGHVLESAHQTAADTLDSVLYAPVETPSAETASQE